MANYIAELVDLEINKKEGIMNEKIKKHLKKFNEENGWELGDNWLYETLTEYGEEVYCEDMGDRRWWRELFVVKKIGGMLIGFGSANTTGDESPIIMGWEFDEESICEMVEKKETKIVTIYEKI